MQVSYWLSLLKVVTIIVSEGFSQYSHILVTVLHLIEHQIFIIIGIVVNCGGNTEHRYIGDQYWHVGEAPFVGGIGGFASVFVTASFA